MRDTRFVLVIAVALASFVATANAAENCPPDSNNYQCRQGCNDQPFNSQLFCYHRVFNALLTCVDQGTTRCSPNPPKPEAVVPPEQVNTAINCELVQANDKTRDALSAATINEDLTFTLVSTQSQGVSFASGIPVFSVGSIRAQYK
jgi:hypothetical protein